MRLFPSLIGMFMKSRGLTLKALLMSQGVRKELIF